MLKKSFLWIALVAITLVHGQEDLSLSYYLPEGTSYNSEIPTPKEVIGHEVGEWHVTHDKLVQYYQALAKSSDRITLESRGSTYEGRPILLLTVSSPANLARIEEIREAHLAATEENSSGSVTDRPIVVYQGFSVHGNEPSGANAALAYAYHLAAAEGQDIEDKLKNMVILLDPSFNPDGLQRFAYWANTNRSMNLNPDNNEREYHEVWPGGRTNHYWFDLNRDWLPVQLPESKARLATFHKWLPNILTDHHEMGTNSTFFFQPGEPDRVHPLTPEMNQELTAEIGTYHAKALDGIGSLYYTEENYDDYYYGKGSTFPDVNGSIGILFEQGSSRGHIQESENGILTFPFTIKNQFTTALSTIEAAENMREKILSYQQSFYEDVRSEAGKDRVKGFVFGSPENRAASWELARILEQHKIKVHHLEKDLKAGGETFSPGTAYIAPSDQKNYRLLKAMFEKRTTFKDSLFYDISAWTFPLAFNVDYASVGSLDGAGQPIEKLEPLSGSVDKRSNYAYLFEWHEYFTPKALNRIVNKGLRAKVAKGPFTLEGKKYDYGTIMVPVANQDMDAQAIHDFLTEVAKDSYLQIHGVSTGYTQGIDLGSNEFDPVKKQKVALIVGSGIRSYDAGEIWHLFDTRYDMQITKIDTEYLQRVDLSDYTDIIIPSVYSTSVLDSAAAKKLDQWARSGG
ncbi:MAG: zinc carboxypeptidase, partial [Flavobacteriaceae bacterium]|nr:zinc carboxypeptidase [Flavobacteriaceae bacterium]